MECTGNVRIDVDETYTETFFELELHPYTLTALPECGTLDYKFTSSLTPKDTLFDGSTYNLFEDTSGDATFDLATMKLKFDNFKDYEPGLLKVDVEVRQLVAATDAVGSVAYLSDVAYTESFNVRIVSCLTETIEKDKVDQDSKAFFNTYFGKTLEYRFDSNGKTLFSETIHFKDKYIFPDAIGFCEVAGYEITCFDQQVNTDDPSISPTNPHKFYGKQRIGGVERNHPDNDFGSLCS